jgi:hypothetical protein
MERESLGQKYRIEIARLDEELRAYERLWSRLPRFTVVFASVPVVAVLYGLGWAVAALLASAALVGTQAYLIAVRKSENRWTREKLCDDLRELEHADARAETPSGVHVAQHRAA